MTLHGAVAAALRAAGLDPADTERVVRQALAEDLAWGPDVTTAVRIAGMPAVPNVAGRGFRQI